jgi:hypothetical protein
MPIEPNQERIAPWQQPLPRVGHAATDAGSVARIIQARALSTGMDRGVHPTRLKQLGRHKSYAVLDAYLELGDPFETPPLTGLL